MKENKRKEGREREREEREEGDTGERVVAFHSTYYYAIDN